MEKKQSSIEWLISILNKPGFAPVLTEEEIQQAKQMHKKEIVDAYSEAIYDHRQEDGEQYYNETFGGDNE